MTTSDPLDLLAPLIKPIDMMGVVELVDHLAERHGITLSAPDRYLPGHRRNHAERLHFKAHSVRVYNHRHPYEPDPPEVPTS